MGSMMSAERQRLLASGPADLTLELLGSPDRHRRLRQSLYRGAGACREGFAGLFSCEGRGVLFQPWEGAQSFIPYSAFREHRQALPARVVRRLDGLHREHTRIAVARFDLTESRCGLPDPYNPGPAFQCRDDRLVQQEREAVGALRDLLPSLLPLASAEPHDLFDLAGISI